MGYMERNVDKRIDPTLIVPNAKSVVSVLLNYFPENPSVSSVPPKISRYALSLDYHLVIKNLLYKMLEEIKQIANGANGRAFVDSAPVLERVWAAKAGLGWIGKNSMLINPNLGSYVFIGELIVNIEIEPSTSQVPNRCGSCTKCIDSCPTGAIVLPGVVDARKCISYLTIEKKSNLSDEEKKTLNGWCFGCDICQEVCPWNSKAKSSSLPDIKPKSEIILLDCKSLSTLTQSQFEQLFGDTPVSRAGFQRFAENVRNSMTE